MLIIQRMTLLAALVIGFVAGSCVAVGKEDVKVDFYVTVPDDTDRGAVIYLAGNLPQLGGWKADGVPLKRVNGDPVYHAELKLPRGTTLEYKITRGTWETVEKGPADEELHNRTLKLEQDRVERVRVARWRSDVEPGMPAVARKSTVTGDVRSHDFQSSILKNRRKLLVWLPPGYEKNPDARYPVLYMQDGQNLFDDSTSFAGEWHADEIAQQLVTDGRIEPIIIVGVENTWQRVLEYTPAEVGGAGGKADLYARMLVEEIKPLIDKTYRTKPDRAHTGVAGSSLGGLVSLYMVKKYPDLFGQCAAVSPSLSWGNGQFARDAERDVSWASTARIWLDMGTAESADPEKARNAVRQTAAFAELLKNSGLTPGRDFAWKAFAGAEHNEQAWAERFDEILLFLYGKP